MSDPIDDLKAFFSTSKALKTKGKVRQHFLDFLRHFRFRRISFNFTSKSQITNERTNNDRKNSTNLFSNSFNWLTNSPGLIALNSPPTFLPNSSNPDYSSIWQSLVDVTSDIVNSYGALHSSTDPYALDIFFKSLLQVRE